MVIDSLIGEELRLAAFSQLSGNLAGYPFVKLVVDSGLVPAFRRKAGILHAMNHAVYPFHAHYIAEKILRIPVAEIEAKIDEFNRSLYFDPDRRFFLGILSLHGRNDRRDDKRFFVLETVEVDSMDEGMLRYFFSIVRAHVDPSIPLLFKPANHLQEQIVARISPSELPRIFNHELFASASFVPLNAGKSTGRLRVFRSEEEYRSARQTIEWFDVLVMHKVPDDIPRISGVINAEHTTPLSHTNVLASGWGIPNCTQLGVIEQITREGLDGQWVEYTVEMNAAQASLSRAQRPAEISRPAWSVHHIKLEEPEAVNTKIRELSELHMSDRYKYGTKAANLGELKRVLESGGERLPGFYRVKRPPRDHLMPYLSKFLGVDETADISKEVKNFLRREFVVPRGIAIPFSIQQEFLESSPRIQQAIGKLKMAIELNAREIDSLALSLQKMIVAARMPEKVRGYIDAQIASHLAGVSSFVVRSSSNAEDLENFSAAGIYESINHVSNAEKIFESIKQVWASLVSPRSVRLRNEVGISLDESYMGVIVQEEVKASLGGVLVTTNPMSRTDFRNVYINVSPHSVQSVVEGAELPLQYLYNTVEGGGRTLSLGSAKQDLSPEIKDKLQRLAFAGRLLQSHFAPDYTFSAPVDIEWAMDDEKIILLQLRPYATGSRAVKA
ncbi:phosphoenolpyruvate synthase [bacterium]|nr:phosphoenolpyruvate synthase [bacterium]